MLLIAEAEKLWPHNASVTALTFRLDTPLHVHLGQGADQRLLRALIALEQLGRKPTIAILRHPQFKGPHPSDQRAAVIAAAVGQPGFRPLPLGGADRLGHLCLERRLNQRLDCGADKIRILRQQFFHIDQPRLTLAFGHGVLPCNGWVMATSPRTMAIPG